jgi:hypothetical protein
VVFLARICKKKKKMLTPEKKGLALELFLVLSTPALNNMVMWNNHILVLQRASSERKA